jgi:hypothetical protein
MRSTNPPVRSCFDEAWLSSVAGVFAPFRRAVGVDRCGAG